MVEVNGYSMINNYQKKITNLKEQVEKLISNITDLELAIEELKQGYAFDMRNKQLEIISLKNQLNLFEDN